MYHTDFLICECAQPRTHYTRLDGSCKLYEWLFVCHLITCIQIMNRYSIQIYEGQSTENRKNLHTYVCKYLWFSVDSPSYVTKHDEDDYTSAVITL